MKNLCIAFCVAVLASACRLPPPPHEAQWLKDSHAKSQQMGRDAMVGSMESYKIGMITGTNGVGCRPHHRHRSTYVVIGD